MRARFQCFFVCAHGTRACTKMNSVTKLDVVEHLWDKDVKPLSEDFESIVENYLLEKFNLKSFEIEEKCYQELQTEISIFRKQYRNKFGGGHNKIQFKKKYKVRQFRFFQWPKQAFTTKEIEKKSDIICL